MWALGWLPLLRLQGTAPVPTGHAGLLNQREETPKQTEKRGEARDVAAAWGVGL